MAKVIKLTESELTNLVKKVIKENQQEMEVQQMTSEFNQKVGEDLTPEEYKEVMCTEPGEIMDIPNIDEEQRQKVDELKGKMKSASFAQLMQLKKQLKELKRQSKQQNEQIAGPAVISLLGVSMPPAFAIAIGGIIFIMLLTFLSRFIHFRKTTTYFCDGTRSRGLFGLLRW